MNECKCGCHCGNYKPVENWIEKIMNTDVILGLRTIDQDRIHRPLRFGNKNMSANYHYNQFYLRCIIEAVAELVNDVLIDWNNCCQTKKHFYYDIVSSAVEIGCNNYYYSNNIYFTNNGIIKAKEILLNLNGMNILELYYKPEGK